MFNMIEFVRFKVPFEHLAKKPREITILSFCDDLHEIIVFAVLVLDVNFVFLFADYTFYSCLNLTLILLL